MHTVDKLILFLKHLNMHVLIAYKETAMANTFTYIVIQMHNAFNSTET